MISLLLYLALVVVVLGGTSYVVSLILDKLS